MRIIPDHTKSQFSELRDKEVAFTAALLRERVCGHTYTHTRAHILTVCAQFADCRGIGRDLVRLLIDVARIPEFESVRSHTHSRTTHHNAHSYRTHIHTHPHLHTHIQHPHTHIHPHHTHTHTHTA